MGAPAEVPAPVPEESPFESPVPEDFPAAPQTRKAAIDDDDFLKLIEEDVQKAKQPPKERKK